MNMQDHLQKLVNYYPVSSRQEHVLQLLEYVKKYVHKYKLYTEILEYNGVYNLYASTRPAKHNRILLQGHIDVVPAKNQPFSVSNGRFYGRGTYDMLFATACYLRLCDDLNDQLQQYDIGFMLSGDEEVGGFNGVGKFLEDGYTADVCILPDAGEGYGSLNVAAKGIATHSIRVYGKSHHGSRPWEGDGAGSKLVHFLAEAEGIFDPSDQSNSTMTIAMISAGHADNQGPSYADATLDVRYKDKADLSRIQQAIDRLLKKYDGKVQELIEGDDYQLDLSNGYVKSFIELYKKQSGQELNFTKAHGSSDARFFSALNIPVIMLRPDGGGAHGDNEWISIEGIEKFYQLLKEYILKTATIGDKS